MKPVYSERRDHIASRQPVTVSRYRGLTRLNHWVTALSLILLALSGLALFHPVLYPLSALFGGGQTVRWLHPVIGVVLFFSFLILFLQLFRLNLPRREDRVWLSHLGAVVSNHEERLPELGKYNAGQKLVFWAMAVLILVLIVTGVMIWEEQIPLWAAQAPSLATVSARRIAVAIHALAAVAMILVFILHVYAAFWTRGTLRGMTLGTVTGGWAWKHHRKWLRELAGRQGSGPAD